MPEWLGWVRLGAAALLFAVSLLATFRIPHGALWIPAVAAIECCQGFAVYNLGNSNPVTLRDLIDRIGKVVGRAPKIRQEPFQPGDVETTFADISRAQQALGYNPRVPINTGLEQMYAWLQNHQYR